MAACAFLFVPTGEGFCLLEYLAVREGCRGRGIGAELFRRAAAVGAVAGATVMLLEVDAPRGGGRDAERRQAFYRRLGCLRALGCDYRLPLPGVGPPPAMDLMASFGGAAPPPLPRDRLRRWLGVIYQGVYGCAADDPRVSAMAAGVGDPVRWA